MQIKEGQSEDVKCPRCQKDLDKDILEEIDENYVYRVMKQNCYKTYYFRNLVCIIMTSHATIMGLVDYIHAKAKTFILILRKLRISY